MPEFPKGENEFWRYVEELLKQHSVDIQRLWDRAPREHEQYGEPLGGGGDPIIPIPTTTTGGTTTTGAGTTTTAATPACSHCTGGGPSSWDVTLPSAPTNGTCAGANCGSIPTLINVPYQSGCTWFNANIGTICGEIWSLEVSLSNAGFGQVIVIVTYYKGGIAAYVSTRTLFYSCGSAITMNSVASNDGSCNFGFPTITPVP